MATRSQAAKEAQALFSGEIDYASVTDFRESLLPAVAELDRNPTKRYLITKHGRPLAVFISFEAFESVRKLVGAILAREDEKDVSQVLAEARQRMDSAHGVASRRERATQRRDLPEDVATQLKAIRDAQARLESTLDRALRKGTLRSSKVAQSG